jgi:hypothetical protein
LQQQIDSGAAARQAQDQAMQQAQAASAAQASHWQQQQQAQQDRAQRETAYNQTADERRIQDYIAHFQRHLPPHHFDASVARTFLSSNRINHEPARAAGQGLPAYPAWNYTPRPFVE